MVNMNNLNQELIDELAFTEEDLEALKKARTLPVTFDEDCPETTPEKAINFKRVNPPRKLQNKNFA